MAILVFERHSLVTTDQKFWTANRPLGNNDLISIPMIAACKLKGKNSFAYIFKLGRNDDIVLEKHNGWDRPEFVELAGYKDTVMTPKGANPNEAFSFLSHPARIHDDTMEDYEVQFERHEDIKDGMIVVDNQLPHGERFYFAEEGVAVASDCHEF